MIREMSEHVVTIDIRIGVIYMGGKMIRVCKMELCGLLLYKCYTFNSRFVARAC